MTTQAAPQREPELPQKHASAKALTRLGHAKAAIAATKKVLHFGAGNQMEAIAATQMNSNFRLNAMREQSYWTLAPELYQLASENPEAYTAAQADLVHGGNCGEHAYIDHCFVHLGDKDKEAASDVAVSDPWPTQATACLWEDHFCYATTVEVSHSMQADGKSVKGAIAAGLRLTEAGKKAAAGKATEAETQDALAKRKENHFWGQPDTVDEGKKFNYVK
jgi:hypothetical protein